MKTKYNIIAFIFIGVLGAVSHFVFKWSGENTIIGYFFPINESTFEHLKLLFFPTILFSIIEYYFVKKEIKNYFFSVTFSLIIGMISIVVLFYTYSGVLGYTIDFLNIIIFYISIIIMLIFKNKFIINEKFSSKNWTLISIVILFGITLSFIFFTYNPPRINLFAPPV